MSAERRAYRDHRAHLEAARQTLGSDIEAIDLLNDLRDRLGPDSPHLADPESEVTAAGRVVVYAGGFMYHRDERDGTPVATLTRGGTASFAYVGPDGLEEWERVPLGDPSMN